MNINPEFESPSRPDMQDSMQAAMSYLFDNFIQPRHEEIDEEDSAILATIGIMFKDMAEKAEAYYQLQENGYEENDFSHN